MARRVFDLRTSGVWLLVVACLPHVQGTCNETVISEDQRIQERVQYLMQTGKDDATWVLTSSFVILTMQSGFGSLESGCVDKKFEVNVMMKNVIDVVFGGLSYWMFGYGMCFGNDWGGFVGVSEFFPDVAASVDEMARTDDTVDKFSRYIFQFTFASTATTIVSGSVAGRMKFSTYMVFSFVNTLVYAVPCHWVWGDGGWLYDLGFVDFAGDGPVHLMGGVNGLVGAFLIGCRSGRWDASKSKEFELKNPLSCIFGLFMLWWGWLGFNCGSTFGISQDKWLLASRIAVTTINASVGGGVFGTYWSFYMRFPGLVDVASVINGILAGLVAITGGCHAMSPAEAFLVGLIGAWVSLMTNEITIKWQVDDPVGAFGVHGTAAIWGLIAIGLFGSSDLIGGPAENGLFYGGGLHLLGIQFLGWIAITVWTTFTSWLFFKMLHVTMGLRCTDEEERIGFDVCEHACPDLGADLEEDMEEADLPHVLEQQLEGLRAEVWDANATFDMQKWELAAVHKRNGTSPRRMSIKSLPTERIPGPPKKLRILPANVHRASF